MSLWSYCMHYVIIANISLFLAKRVPGNEKKKEEQLERKAELEKKLQDMTGQLKAATANAKKPKGIVWCSLR